MKQPNLEFELFAPVAVVTGLSIAALIILMVVSAGRVDQTSASREQALVVNAVRERIVQVERAAINQAASTPAPQVQAVPARYAAAESPTPPPPACRAVARPATATTGRG